MLNVNNLSTVLCSCQCRTQYFSDKRNRPQHCGNNPSCLKTSGIPFQYKPRNHFIDKKKNRDAQNQPGLFVADVGFSRFMKVVVNMEDREYKEQLCAPVKEVPDKTSRWGSKAKS